MHGPEQRAPLIADVAELVDALDLGSSIERCGSSSLPIRTSGRPLYLFFARLRSLPVLVSYRSNLLLGDFR